MPTFATKRPVPFTAAQMYALVADVERYPEFLPMCTGLRVTSRAPSASGEELIATMSVGYKSIRETFTTRVDLQPGLPGVDVAYLNGPFSHLDNRWRFINTPGGGSEIDFYINYAFRSALLGALVGSVFEQAFRKFAVAFEERARAVYGVAAKT
ncbi:MAG: SRPBCC family protein, partial [Hyphomicrobium sp.]